MPIQSPTNDAVALELERLSRSSIHELRTRWRALFRRETPPAFGPDLLRRSIAQKLQEDLYGKLPPTARRELTRIVASLEKNPAARVDLPRRVKVGAVLVRDWKGASHRVTVAENGFSYHERNYTSLSEIAREITSTRWNGPRFFGLRSNGKSDKNEQVDGATNRKHQRLSKQTAASRPTRTSEASHGL